MVKPKRSGAAMALSPLGVLKAKRELQQAATPAQKAKILERIRWLTKHTRKESSEGYNKWANFAKLLMGRGVPISEVVEGVNLLNQAERNEIMRRRKEAAARRGKRSNVTDLVQGMRNYVTEEGYGVNEALRYGPKKARLPHVSGGPKGAPLLKERDTHDAAKSLNKLFRVAHPLTRPLVVYRGIQGLNRPRPKPGEVITDPGFMSTAASKSQAAMYADTGKGYILKLVVPAGTKVLRSHKTSSFEPDEGGSFYKDSEIILPPRMRYKVVAQTGPNEYTAHVLPGQVRVPYAFALSPALRAKHMTPTQRARIAAYLKSLSPWERKRAYIYTKLAKQPSKQRTGITDLVQGAKDYVNEEGRDINEMLRLGPKKARYDEASGGQPMLTEPDRHNAARSMNKLFRVAHPISKPIVVYRGIQGLRRPRPKIGQVITDPGFMSTSAHKGQAAMYKQSPYGEESNVGTGYLLKLVVPKGTKVLMTHKTMNADAGFVTDAEIVLPPRMQYKIVSQDGPNQYTAHVLPGQVRVPYAFAFAPPITEMYRQLLAQAPPNQRPHLINAIKKEHEGVIRRFLRPRARGEPNVKSLLAKALQPMGGADPEMMRYLQRLKERARYEQSKPKVKSRTDLRDLLGATKEYVHHAGIETSKLLRAGPKKTKSALKGTYQGKIAGAMNKLFRIAHPLTKPIVVYRGVKGVRRPEPKIGDVITDAGFMSTSATYKQALTYAKHVVDPASFTGTQYNPNGYVIKMVVPAGTKVLMTHKAKPWGALNPTDAEIVLPPRMQYKIVSHDGPGQYTAHVLPGQTRVPYAFGYDLGPNQQSRTYTIGPSGPDVWERTTQFLRHVRANGQFTATMGQAIASNNPRKIYRIVRVTPNTFLPNWARVNKLWHMFRVKPRRMGAAMGYGIGAVAKPQDFIFDASGPDRGIAQVRKFINEAEKFGQFETKAMYVPDPKTPKHLQIIVRVTPTTFKANWRRLSILWNNLRHHRTVRRMGAAMGYGIGKKQDPRVFEFDLSGPDGGWDRINKFRSILEQSGQFVTSMGWAEHKAGSPRQVKVRVTPTTFKIDWPAVTKWWLKLRHFRSVRRMGYAFSSRNKDPQHLPTITKKDLAKAVARELGITDVQSARALQSLLDNISIGLKNHGRVEIRNFGVFEVKRYNPRRSVSPRTGEEVYTEGKYTVVFKPSKHKLRHPDAHYPQKQRGVPEFPPYPSEPDWRTQGRGYYAFDFGGGEHTVLFPSEDLARRFIKEAFMDREEPLVDMKSLKPYGKFWAVKFEPVARMMTKGLGIIIRKYRGSRGGDMSYVR